MIQILGVDVLLFILIRRLKILLKSLMNGGDQLWRCVVWGIIVCCLSVCNDDGDDDGDDRI